MSLRSEVIRIFNELVGAGKKITELPPATTPLAGTELLEIVQSGSNKRITASSLSSGGTGVQTIVAGTNVTVDSTDPQNPIVSASGGGGGGTWGSITGTLSDQTDLQGALDDIATDLSDHISDTTDAHAGTAISNIPAGSIAATTVQAAINELDTEKQPIDSDLTAIAALTPSNDDFIQRKAGAWSNRSVAQVQSDLGITTVPDASSSVKGIAKLYPSTSLGTNTDGAPDQNAVKTYVDAVSTTVAGLVIDSIADGDTTHAPSRNSVFDALALKVAKAGDTMSGNLAMGGNKITGLAAATANGDAVRYEEFLVETGQQFETVNAQTGTSYTPVLGDADNSTLITMNNASANNLVIPTNASVAYPVGKILFVAQTGDGITSIVPFDGTVTVTYSAGVSAVAGKNTLNAAFKTGTNTWLVWNGTAPLSPAALTKTNGNYITITLTGNPSTALLQAVDISAELTTAVPVSLGGLGLSAIAAGDIYWGSATNTVAARNVLAATQLALFHIKAGTTAANTAPLMLTTGPVNTTAQAGAIEYTTPQLFFTNGGARRQEIPQIQQSRVSTQFDATSNTTLANITGLTATLVASRIYRFEAILYTTSNVAGGVKFAIAGTATATNVIYECVVIDSNTNAAQTRATALATAVGGVTAVTVAYAKITGTITVNAAGTITVQFSQNASNGSASSVLVGSTFVLTEMV